jgi:hypothetical protein
MKVNIVSKSHSCVFGALPNLWYRSIARPRGYGHPSATASPPFRAETHWEGTLLAWLQLGVRSPATEATEPVPARRSVDLKIR